MHVAFVLHAHLPYVRHPEHARSIEERWLFEATWECYLRLIAVLERAPSPEEPLLTLSVSPTLLEMFADRELRRRFTDHIARISGLADRVRASGRFEGHEKAIDHYRSSLRTTRELYARHSGDLTRAFVSLAESGHIELATTTATHAYLPGLKTGATVRAQLRLGRRVFEQHTRRAPSGLWLPECAYDPRLGADIALCGAKYTVLDTHGLDLARPRPPFDVYAPILAHSGVAFFGREPNATRAIWSREEGYPGHPVYREFYRDVGFDADDETLADEKGPAGTRLMTGLKLHAITGAEPKRAYDPTLATAQAKEHAREFVTGVTERLAKAKAAGVSAPIVVAPFDAELFGHWWYEGPDFLGEVLGLLSAPEEMARPISLSRYLERFPEIRVAEPAASSWGEGGFGSVWTHSETARLWRHVHHAEVRVLEVDAVVRDTLASEKRRRARIQAIRELLLLESSDWAFMLRQGDMSEYANMRVRLHASRIERLTALALTEAWTPDDLSWLTSVEAHTPLFSSLDEDTYAHVFDPW